MDVSSGEKGTPLNPLHTPTYKSEGFKKKGKYTKVKMCKKIAGIM